MIRLIRFLLTLAIIGAFVWFGATIPLGKHTLFGHFKRIWDSKETQDLIDGTKEAAKPAAEKVKRSVQAGVDEAKKDH
jgi:hypothetical protein